MIDCVGVGVASTSCDAPASPRPNVILISIDTLRPDHLGCYGYGEETSPELDRFALDSVVFDRAAAHAPSTLPSHASLLTSLLPQHHGASHVERRALPEAALTLAEVFTRQGYRSASFNGGGQLVREFGLDQGFEVYESVEHREDRLTAIAERAVSWLDAAQPRHFFLFLHSYEAHQPFTAESHFYRDRPGTRAAAEDSMELLRQVRDGALEPLNRFRGEIDT